MCCQTIRPSPRRATLFLRFAPPDGPSSRPTAVFNVGNEGERLDKRKSEQKWDFEKIITFRRFLKCLDRFQKKMEKQTTSHLQTWAHRREGTIESESEL